MYKKKYNKMKTQYILVEKITSYLPGAEGDSSCTYTQYEYYYVYNIALWVAAIGPYIIYLRGRREDIR